MAVSISEAYSNRIEPHIAELQIRGGIEDNSKIISLNCQQNRSYDPSIEPSRCDGSNDGSQNEFLGRIETVLMRDHNMF